MREKFRQFLIEHNAINQWYHNATESVGDAEKFLLNHKPESYIGGAFVWDVTPEGHGVWARLSGYWDKSLE